LEKPNRVEQYAAMKIVEQIVPYTVASLPQQGGAKPTGAREYARDHIDAINQLFAEMELAYHNQFHKAFGQAESQALAKKYWLQSLATFAPDVIRRAGRAVVQSQQFLPSLAAMIAACEDSPSPEAAAGQVRLPANVPNPLSPEQNREKLKALRKQFDL
jgi:hypothetical protein